MDIGNDDTDAVVAVTPTTGRLLKLLEEKQGPPPLYLGVLSSLILGI